MSETYPHHVETGLGLDEASAAELQRLLARVKQEQAQLVADQRQLKQQRILHDRRKTELDTRQQELERSLAGFQQERQTFLDQKESFEQELDAQRTELESAKQSLDAHTADLRQREQQLASRHEQLNTDTQHLAARQKDLDQQAQTLQAEQQALIERKASLDQLASDLNVQSARLTERASQREQADQTLSAAREELHAREQQAQRHSVDLAKLQQLLAQRETSLSDRQITLDAQQEDLRRQLDKMQAEQNELREQKEQLATQARSLESRQQALVRQEEFLHRQQAEWAAKEAGARQQSADLEKNQAQAAQRQQELAALAESLERKQEELTTLEGVLADKQLCLGQMEADLRRRQQALPVAGVNEPAAANQAKQIEDLRRQVAQRDAQAQAAAEQVVSLNKRFEGLQAELAVLREQKQNLSSQRETLSQEHASLQDRCQALQRRVDELVAAGPAVDGDASAAPAGEAPDVLATIAAHAAAVRRPVKAPVSGRSRRQAVLIAVCAAVMAGVLATSLMLLLRPAQYNLTASIVLPAGSPLAERAELNKAQRELGGRLLEASLLGNWVAADSVAVTADVGKRSVGIQLLSTMPERTGEDLKALLTKFTKDLQGQVLTAARTRLAEDLSRKIEEIHGLQEAISTRKAALQSQMKTFGPQEKAYADATAAASKARKDLDELRGRSDKAAAELRVLLRTPPASRADVTAERLATEEARDSQLVAVRGQVAVRGAELREMLGKLVGTASDACGQMDSHVAKFGTYLDSQAKQIPDESLQAEVKQIGEVAGQLRRIVQDSRRQIETLSAAITKAKDVSQAPQLVDLHARCEKALELLINQAADSIKQIDGLLEKIPAGGEDVTRRTVLQQRLRSSFAEVLKTHQNVSDALNDLRPSVNFRLDAALSGVEGLSRQLEERQRSLTEQVRQQDARQSRQKYDKQVQDARAELDDLNIQRDRVLAALTAASDAMLRADTGRSKRIELRGQLADLDRQAAELDAELAAAQSRADNLQATASHPAPIAMEGPTTLEAPVNGRSRLLAAGVSGVAVFALVLACCGVALGSRKD